MRRLRPDSPWSPITKARPARLPTAVRRMATGNAGPRAAIREDSRRRLQPYKKFTRNAYLNILREECWPPNAIEYRRFIAGRFCLRVTGSSDLRSHAPYKSPRRAGHAGLGFPPAARAKVAMPYRALVAIPGDGGFSSAVANVATPWQSTSAWVTLLSAPSYGHVRREPTRDRFDGRVCTDLSSGFRQTAEILRRRARPTSPIRCSPRWKRRWRWRPYLISRSEVPEDSGHPWSSLHPPKP